MKRFIVILLSLTLLFTISFPAFATSTEALTPSQKQEIEFQSNLEYTALLDSFWADYDGGYIYSDMPVYSYQESSAPW